MKALYLQILPIMKPAISVIICTHNPRYDYLDRALEALKSQTLPIEQWELLLVDNASSKPLSLEINLSWHPSAHSIREEQLGLTPARLRGIQEAKAETLVFVDDDNVLDADYLEVTLKISKDWPMLGAWGGQTIGHFDKKPPAWTQPLWEFLGIREFNQDKWSNLMLWETTPIGAGMCVRKPVAEKYVSLMRNDPKRSNLDRQGQALLSCGDLDLAYTSCDMGLGTGLFASLKLLHLMPASRLEEQYLLRLIEGTKYSNLMLGSFRGSFPAIPSWKKRLWFLMRPWFVSPRAWLMRPRARQIYQAQRRGILLAIEEIAKNAQFSRT